MKVLDLSQGGSDWHQWRHRGIGASDASIIMGVSKYTTRAALMDKKLGTQHPRPKGQSGPSDMNAAMRRGHDLEPEARRAYTAYTGLRVRPVCIVHDSIDWLRSSLDGLAEDNRTGCEIKCINKIDHAEALAGRVPRMYVPQVQHQLACGLDKVHYWSYSKSSVFSPSDCFAIVVVAPNLSYIEELLAAERRFWEELTARSKKKSKK
jgi:putative phage-type endonuclease